MLKDIFLSVSNPFSNSKSISRSLLSLPHDPDYPGTDSLHRISSFAEKPPAVTLTRVVPRARWDEFDPDRSNSLPVRLKRGQPLSRKLSGDSSKTSQPINIAVVGGRNVGKSALTVRFITKRYIGDYMSGDRQNYPYNNGEENKQNLVNFRDEASFQDQKENLCSQLSKENLTWADAVIMVYDVGDASSFIYVKEAIQRMAEYLPRDNESAGLIRWKPVLVLGNKIDIIRRRQVQDSDVKEAAKKFPSWVCCGQVSAAEEYETIAEHINHLISRVRQRRRLLNNKAKVGSLLRNRTLKPKCHDFIRTQTNSQYESCKS